MSDVNARYRDSVFRSFFNEPTRLLSLCNDVPAKYPDATLAELCDKLTMPAELRDAHKKTTALLRSLTTSRTF